MQRCFGAILTCCCVFLGLLALPSVKGIIPLSSSSSSSSGNLRKSKNDQLGWQHRRLSEGLGNCSLRSSASLYETFLFLEIEQGNNTIITGLPPNLREALSESLLSSYDDLNACKVSQPDDGTPLVPNSTHPTRSLEFVDIDVTPFQSVDVFASEGLRRATFLVVVRGTCNFCLDLTNVALFAFEQGVTEGDQAEDGVLDSPIEVVGATSGPDGPDECCEGPDRLELIDAFSDSIPEATRTLSDGSVVKVTNLVQVSSLVDCDGNEIPPTDFTNVILLTIESGDPFFTSGELTFGQLEELGGAFKFAYEEANAFNYEVCDPFSTRISDVDVEQVFFDEDAGGDLRRQLKTDRPRKLQTQPQPSAAPSPVFNFDFAEDPSASPTSVFDVLLNATAPSEAPSSVFEVRPFTFIVTVTGQCFGCPKDLNLFNFVSDFDPLSGRRTQATTSRCFCPVGSEIRKSTATEFSEQLEDSLSSSVAPGTDVLSLVELKQQNEDNNGCSESAFIQFASSLVLSILSPDTTTTNLSEEQLVAIAESFQDGYIQSNQLNFEICDPFFTEIAVAKATQLGATVGSGDPDDLEGRKLQDSSSEMETPSTAPTSIFNINITPIDINSTSSSPSESPTAVFGDFVLFDILVEVSGRCVGCERDLAVFDFVSDGLLGRRKVQELPDPLSGVLALRCQCPVGSEPRQLVPEEFFDVFEELLNSEESDVGLEEIEVREIRAFVESTDSPRVVPTTTSEFPSTFPSSFPSDFPTISPSDIPSVQPTTSPTGNPSLLPSLSPSLSTSSDMPSNLPSAFPSSLSSLAPSGVPSEAPSTSTPSELPSLSETSNTPSMLPSGQPSTSTPSEAPSTSEPSATPSATPSILPSGQPSEMPSDVPSATPTLSAAPSNAPSFFIPATSCQGPDACTDADSLVLSDNACNGEESCRDAVGLTVGKFSCVADPLDFFTSVDGRACFRLVGTTIGEMSCIGDDACRRDPSDTGTLVSVGKMSCTGEDACSCEDGSCIIGDNSCNVDVSSSSANCVDLQSVTVTGPNSCNGDDACAGATEITIPPNSCNGDSTCEGITRTTFGLDSCVGDFACAGLTDSTVGTKSCVQDDACEDAELLNAGNDSCNGEAACDASVSLIVGSNSCNGESTCENTESLNVGDRSCNGFEACVDSIGVTILDDSCNLDPLDPDPACGGLEPGGTNGDATIGSNSCNGPDACTQRCFGAGGCRDFTVGDRSCNGVEACEFDGFVTDTITIGNDSCNGSDGCSPTYFQIGDNSCNGEPGGFDCACCDSDAPEDVIIGNNACNGGGDACFDLGDGFFGGALTVIGDFSCIGQDACGGSDGIVTGLRSCVGREACRGCDDIIIGNDACLQERGCQGVDVGQIGNNACDGRAACRGREDLTVEADSCVGECACLARGLNQVLLTVGVAAGLPSCLGESACLKVEGTIGADSCVGTGACEGFDLLNNRPQVSIGDGSCKGNAACFQQGEPSKAVSIGNGACIGDGACAGLEGNIQDGACIGDSCCACLGGSGPVNVAPGACPCPVVSPPAFSTCAVFSPPL